MKDRAWLRSLTEERLRVLEREMPAPTAEILGRESQEFLADVDLFLQCLSRLARPTSQSSWAYTQT